MHNSNNYLKNQKSQVILYVFLNNGCKMCGNYLYLILHNRIQSKTTTLWCSYIVPGKKQWGNCVYTTFVSVAVLGLLVTKRGTGPFPGSGSILSPTPFYQLFQLQIVDSLTYKSTNSSNGLIFKLKSIADKQKNIICQTF